MARGQAQAADTQLGKTNAVAGENANKATQLENKLVPGYTSLMDTGYLSPEEENAAVTSEMGSATAPFGTEEFRAGNRAAATRNDAALPAEEDQLAMEQGRTAGDAAAKLQEEKMANQEAGMYGLANQEKGNQQLEGQMYGLGPSTLGARAAGGGWAQGFKDVGQGIAAFTRG